MSGKRYLTNERFVQLARPNMMMWFGLLGVLIASILTKPKVQVDFPLSAIQMTKHGKIGFNNNIMDITTTDGQQHRLMLKWDEWFTSFQQALAGAKFKLTDNGDKSWTVNQ